MTINLKEKLLTLDGKPIKSGDVDLTIGRALASVLANGKSKDPVRSFVLAQSLYKENAELNKSDIEFISATVYQNDIFTDLIKGQLMEKLS